MLFQNSGKDIKNSGNSFEEKDLISFGLANKHGYLTNAE